MAAFARSAPLPEWTGGDHHHHHHHHNDDEVRSLIDDDSTFYNTVDRSLSLTKKIVLSIPEAHRACITAETLDLNSEKGKFAVVAENIGIPVSPILHVLSENATMETSLVQMLNGLLLHQTLLSSVSSHLGPQDTVTELLADTRDLLTQISILLKLVQGDSAKQPAAPQLDLRLQGDFDIQVATHITLRQLRDFGQDMERILRRVAKANEDTTESTESTESTEPEQL
ncbi:hypothetical protein NHX12_024752 [Muraenolepis orangiensis]|uniref:Granulocyte colony-stimulating factor n=1 Tax=Muraenolepis orangiensis TaxID=630683 RepID=A0A9Q0EIT4_9TELE|nr:hypothetical protein NHX12_024752 [Muraenolepis orangiensis]